MDKTLLHTINSPADLKELSLDKLLQLTQELRNFIINAVATKEGHLGASLGVAELTIALHHVFDTPNDLLVWDVGHQAYGHKILTGRRDVFDTNRILGGISGFPKMEESIYDAFGTGHSSTAISAVLGMAMASRLKGNLNKQHIAVVGDASIASGMAFEALNHAGVSNTNLLVILNDNAIGIDPSVGALKNYFTKVSLDGAPDSDNIFEALNFKYTGPVDGHNLAEIISTLKSLKSIEGPKLLHLITKKGKGLKQAEENQVKYHAPGKFNAITGELHPKSETKLPPKFQDVFGLTLVELANKNNDIIGITPAMPTGSSLKYMMEAFPERAFDVGIAEQHAVTLAAGMATQGLAVFCNIYSTFLQRAYDQVIHDVCLQKLPVIFCIDRAGVVGEDGATHHGIFDIAFLRCIPNIIILAPRNEEELRNMLFTAQLALDTPLAIRYPRGRGRELNWEKPFKKIPFYEGELLKQGSKIAILSVGTMAYQVGDAIKLLDTESQNLIAHYDIRVIKPLDNKALLAIFQKFNTIITIEDGIKAGGFGSYLLEFASEYHLKNEITILGFSDIFPQQGSIDELYEIAGLSPIKISEVILEKLV
ncbi:1-deoxy-D-xylulose-5-phosphate synthase [Patiriisocius marinus]|uniref:1-deoxy-D-xylulose-5-phosphate synthase n=1 Tax=Patiriisocius marinus TaxID=1397112 RepID=A0A5J4J1M3_9FLAO|nr:1-deoxy-D-xylulose-5-phosphate synthase [Patiriisocius marinus]GER58397.1 1-deoxy-D-xylulose-5-phosphate synthase [Patiriisocius marinus]